MTKTWCKKFQQNFKNYVLHQACGNDLPNKTWNNCFSSRSDMEKLQFWSIWNVNFNRNHNKYDKNAEFWSFSCSLSRLIRCTGGKKTNLLFSKNRFWSNNNKIKCADIIILNRKKGKKNEKKTKKLLNRLNTITKKTYLTKEYIPHLHFCDLVNKKKSWTSNSSMFE